MSENQENVIKDASQLIGQISKNLSEVDLMVGEHVFDALKPWAISSSDQILEWNQKNAIKAITSEGEIKSSANTMIEQRLLKEFVNTLSRNLIQPEPTQRREKTKHVQTFVHELQDLSRKAEWTMFKKHCSNICQKISLGLNKLSLASEKVKKVERGILNTGIDLRTKEIERLKSMKTDLAAVKKSVRGLKNAPLVPKK